MNERINNLARSILIIPLIILIFTSSLYFLNISSKSNITTELSKNRNIAKHDSERKIDLLLIDDAENKEVFIEKALSYMDYFSDITDEHIRLDKSLLRPGDESNRVYFNFSDYDTVRIQARTEYKNVKVIANKKAKYTNPLLRMEEPIIYSSKLDYKEEEYFNKMIDNIENYWDDLRFRPGFKTYYYKEDHGLDAIQEIKDRRIVIYKAGAGLELTTELRELEGIIYAEGDIYISGDFNFKGIIISKNGKLILEEDSKLENRGIIICKELIGLGEDSENLEDNLSYNYKSILNYGSYFPGILFIDVIESSYD